MNSAWTGENANEKRLVEVADKTLEKLQDFFRDRFTSVNPATTYDVVKIADDLNSFKYLVDGEAGFLKRYLAHVQAHQNAPKRAQALENCDKVLMKLDSIRDIICRSIEGDDDVVCTEDGAQMISNYLDATIQTLPHMATMAYVVEDENKIPY